MSTLLLALMLSGGPEMGSSGGSSSSAAASSSSVSSAPASSTGPSTLEVFVAVLPPPPADQDLGNQINALIAVADSHQWYAGIVPLLLVLSWLVAKFMPKKTKPPEPKK